MTRNGFKNSLIALYCLTMSVSLVACQTQPPAGGQQPVNSTQFWMSTIWFLLVAVSVYYLVVVRPQLANDDAQQKFVRELKKNDEVMTSGGLLGRVHSVADGVVTIEVSPNVRIRVLAQHVKSVPGAPADGKE